MRCSARLEIGAGLSPAAQAVVKRSALDGSHMAVLCRPRSGVKKAAAPTRSTITAVDWTRLHFAIAGPGFNVVRIRRRTVAQVLPVHLRDGPAIALRERAALEVRQTVVVTFQNLRYLFDSSLPMLDKGLRLLDKGFLAVLASNRSALCEFALVLTARLPGVQSSQRYVCALLGSTAQLHHSPAPWIHCLALSGLAQLVCCDGVLLARG